MTKCFETKICPSCGAVCYSDMNRCYECLYEFGTVESRVAFGEACESEEDGELVAVGVVVVKKESAPEGALEITMKFDDTYTNRLAKSFSACS
jgi:predicted amidophosphoribosyltransferase